MPPKKKGKKGKHKKVKVPLPPPMKNVIRTFYELEIADMKKKIERLEACGAENEIVENEIEYLIENRTDDLGKKYFHLCEETTRLEETEDECNKLIKDHKEFLEEHHQEMLRRDCQFVRMVEDHKVNVRLKKSELVQFEEFANNSEAMLNRFQNDEKKYLELEAKQKADLEEMELNLQSYKEQVKQDVDRKLLKLSESFVDKCKETIPKHTQRLIHENIALNNELDRINNTNLTLQNKIDNAVKLNERKRNLQLANQTMVKECQQNLNQITSLLNSIEGMEILTEEYSSMRSLMVVFHRLAMKKIEDLQSFNFDVDLLRRDVHAITIKRAEYKLELRLAKSKYEKYLNTKKKTIWHLEMLQKFDQQKSLGDPPCVFDEQSFQKCTRKKVRQQLLNIVNEVDYIEDSTLLRVDSVDSISKVYTKPDFGGYLDRADYDPYEDDVVPLVEFTEESPRRRRRTKSKIIEEEHIPIMFEIDREPSVESVHSAILIDVEADDTEFFFEPSDAELSEIEEDEADEEDFNYSSSD